MTVSISNMAQVWMSNTNTYNGIAMSISTMGYGANTNSRIFKLRVDGNTKFDIDANGRVTALDITANTVSVNTIIALSSANAITTGTLTSNTITTGSLSVTNRNISKGSMPTGSILQVVQSVKTDTFTTSSTTPVDITNMTASITPTSSTSKIMVRVDLKWTIYGHGDIYLLRNGTKIYYGDLSGIQTQSSLHGYGSGSYGNDYGLCYGGIEYLDSPATTSSVTYKLQAAVPHSASYIIAVNYPRPNENGAYNSRLASTITLYEIAQ
jgi:hypothetical protein